MIRVCRNCHEPVQDDGYGDLIHAFFYGCDPHSKKKEYPVAR